MSRICFGFARNTNKNKRIEKFADVISKFKVIDPETKAQTPNPSENQTSDDQPQTQAPKTLAKEELKTPVPKNRRANAKSKPAVPANNTASEVTVAQDITGEIKAKVVKKAHHVVTDIDFDSEATQILAREQRKEIEVAPKFTRMPSKTPADRPGALELVGQPAALPMNTLTRQEIEQIDIRVTHQKERVSKYLSRSSACSRRQAERLIEQGMVRVNGKKILTNVEIDPLKDEVSLFTVKGEYFPMKDSTKVWLFYKPIGMICTHKDPNNRPTIFQYIQKLGTIKEDFIISVGRLDYNSEGLMILTNDGELARVLELPLNKVERSYRVRVFGRFDEDKLSKIRKGAVIKGVQYGPFWCDVDHYQTRNTWLLIKMTQGKNREIRKIMQKHSLRVNRLKRLTYGPYSLGNMAAGEIREAVIEDDIKRLMYLSKRATLKQKEAAKDTEEEIKQKVVQSLEGRLKDPLSLLVQAKERTRALESDTDINATAIQQ